MADAIEKWNGKPLYDRPLGQATKDLDDGRSVIWITDFSACGPAENLAQWSLIDYATEDFQGNLLYARKDLPTPELTLELNVSGWYAVYLWLMGGDPKVANYHPDCDSVYSMSDGPALKLTGDGCFASSFRALSHNQMFWPGLESCFWKHAELTDQTLTIKHQGGAIYFGAIELIPLSPAEVKAVEADRASREHKRVIVKSDTYTADESRRMYETIRHTDVCGWITSAHSTADIMHPDGSPALKRLRQDTRELGIEAYACDRPSLWSSYHFSDDQRCRDFATHPEWHCLDRDGADTHAASYAHPEVQDYMLARARACAQTGIDGYGYFLCRDPGWILFEPVAMKGFQEKHGVDPCTLSDRDDRLLDWRADIITAYMHRLRQVLDEVAQENNFQRIKMVHVVLGDEAAHRFFSFDLERWIKEGLADIICPYPWTDYPDRWLAQGFVEVDVKYFASICEGSDCKIYPNWLSSVPGCYNWVLEHVRPNEYFKKAMADYAAGADGISTWDHMGGSLYYPFMADRWLRLGHKDDLATWAEHDFPLPPRLRFTRYDGRTPDRYPAGTGG